MNLSIATNIPFREWVNEDIRVVATAFDILRKEQEDLGKKSPRTDRGPGAGGPQFSG